MVVPRSVRAAALAGGTCSCRSRTRAGSVSRSSTRREGRLGARFFEACERFCAGYGIRIERVLTDNGTRFGRRRQLACEQRRIAVRKTRQLVRLSPVRQRASETLFLCQQRYRAAWPSIGLVRVFERCPRRCPYSRLNIRKNWKGAVSSTVHSGPAWIRSRGQRIMSWLLRRKTAAAVRLAEYGATGATPRRRR